MYNFNPKKENILVKFKRNSFLILHQNFYLMSEIKFFNWTKKDIFSSLIINTICFRTFDFPDLTIVKQKANFYLRGYTKRLSFSNVYLPLGIPISDIQQAVLMLQRKINCTPSIIQTL